MGDVVEGDDGPVDGDQPKEPEQVNGPQVDRDEEDEDGDFLHGEEPGVERDDGKAACRGSDDRRVDVGTQDGGDGHVEECAHDPAPEISLKKPGGADMVFDNAPKKIDREKIAEEMPGAGAGVKELVGDKLPDVAVEDAVELEGEPTPNPGAQTEVMFGNHLGDEASAQDEKQHDARRSPHFEARLAHITAVGHHPVAEPSLRVG